MRLPISDHRSMSVLTRQRLFILFCAALLVAGSSLRAQNLSNATPPPIGAPMRQVNWDQLSNRNISSRGAEALAMNPRNWFHGETEDFIIHYRTFSDALQIAREIEFDLWYVAKTLGATKEQYARKSHVYLFRDDNEWQRFVGQVHHRESWAHSFADGDDLFLNVHG